MSRLHEFDLLLCDYVRYNLRRHLGDKVLAQRLGQLGDGVRDYFGIKFTVVPAQGSEPTARPGGTQVDSAETVSAEAPGVELNSTQTPAIESQVAEAPVSEASDAQAGSTTSGDVQTSAADTGGARAPTTKIEVEVVPAPDRNVSFLLSDIELDQLETIVASLARFKSWQASRTVHGSYHFCTGEINRRLSPDDAERWAKRSVRFTRQLQRRRVSLEVGISIVREWVRELRSCLAAMDETDLLPAPGGGFPTPTNPNPPKPEVHSAPGIVPPTQQAQQPRKSSLPTYIVKLRRAIQGHKDGAKADETELIQSAHVNRAFGLKALHELERLGEYNGFGKSRADRSQKAATEPTSAPPTDSTDNSSQSPSAPPMDFPGDVSPSSPSLSE